MPGERRASEKASEMLKSPHAAADRPEILADPAQQAIAAEGVEIDRREDHESDSQKEDHEAPRHRFHRARAHPYGKEYAGFG